MRESWQFPGAVGVAGGKISRGVITRRSRVRGFDQVRADLRDAAYRVDVGGSEFEMRVAKFGRARRPCQFQRSFRFRPGKYPRADSPGRIRGFRDKRDTPARKTRPAGQLRPRSRLRRIPRLPRERCAAHRAARKICATTIFESADARAFAARVRTLYAIVDPAGRAKSSARERIVKFDLFSLQIVVHLFGRDGVGQPPNGFLVRGGTRGNRGAVDFQRGVLGERFAIGGARGQRERQSETALPNCRAARSVTATGTIGCRATGSPGAAHPAASAHRRQAKRERPWRNEAQRRITTGGFTLGVPPWGLHHGVRGYTG